MGTFIPAVKIDKIMLSDGIVIRGEIVAGDENSLRKFTKALELFFAEWRERGAKEQTEIDFRSGVSIPRVELRADKPKLKDKTYSIGIDMTNVSMDDRSKLFAMSQDKSKEIHFSITTQPKAIRTTKMPRAADETKPVGAEGNGSNAETNAGSDETKAAAGETKYVVYHGDDRLDLPLFEADTVEERLQKALLIRDADALERWAGRVKVGLTDKDLRKALDSEWARGAQYEAPDDGRHFIVQGGGTPKFRLAPSIGVRANLTSKPTLEGAKLLAKVREVLGLEDPSKKKVTKTQRATATA